MILAWFDAACASNQAFGSGRKSVEEVGESGSIKQSRKASRTATYSYSKLPLFDRHPTIPSISHIATMPSGQGGEFHTWCVLTRQLLIPL